MATPSETIITKLQEILAAANALPEAGNSGVTTTNVCYVGTAAPDDSVGQDGDIFIVKE